MNQESVGANNHSPIEPIPPAVRLAAGLQTPPATALNARWPAQKDAPATPAAAPAKNAPEALLRAAALLQERGATYDAQFGDAPHEARERSMARTVAAFNALHGTALTEAQGWSFMLCLKLVRLFCAPGFHEDSADDAVAYAALLAEGKAREGESVGANNHLPLQAGKAREGAGAAALA